MTRAWAQRLAAYLYRVYGVTHDPRAYRCRICGTPQRVAVDYPTMGEGQRLCRTCMYDHGKLNFPFVRCRCLRCRLWFAMQPARIVQLWKGGKRWRTGMRSHGVDPKEAP